MAYNTKSEFLLLGENMRGWQITKPFELEEFSMEEIIEDATFSKAKTTKALLTLSDVLRFNGEIKSKGVILGSYGIGFITEPGLNLFDIEKGSRVYVEPSTSCGECYNCNNNDPQKCSNLQIAGEDFHGFLRDFVHTDSNNLFKLPDSVSDLSALFIEHVSTALKIIDELKIKKGDHVVILGANNLGNIIAQILIYYQAIPIVLEEDEENIEIARKSGIYYVFQNRDEWYKEVHNITGGRMAECIIYVMDTGLPTKTAFTLAGYNTPVAFTGTNFETTNFSTATANKKQLNIMFISSGYGYTASSINLLANDAINFSHMKINTIKYNEVPDYLKELNNRFEKGEKIYETVVEIE
ncbi:MAG: zinc-binding dehydrogenase [Clostridia bacterium]|nr:zinc-binding dehydrogenase [Clostridia bacterium]